MVFARCVQHILRNIDQHRPRPTGSGDVKCLMHNAAEIIHIFHQIIMFGGTAGDAHRVGFLKRVGTDQMRWHLPCHTHQRNRIHQRIRQRCYGVRGPRPRGHHQHAHFASRARIAFGCVACTLFVPHQNMPQFILFKQRIIDRQHRTAGIAEHHVGTVIEHRLNHDFSPCHFADRGFFFRLVAGSARGCGCGHKFLSS